ncbi:NUDIX hydrolase [Aurantiacibacter sediminis]|uniref:NUDIX domain-containing protein n=1 Tax=Aurantiacibacter sediminis TaxID=2793064 RepID=A0ABS0N021_9SPHN|nr:NUDIX domain-containing protein [Aurantiacibacter sediminis]MBH5321316.1 NUDIX domain-containing protein [Aurantiacibacter sediminis]
MGGLSPITIAAALIDDDKGRLLLVRKRNTKWFMQAGGKIEPGETAQDALRRELKEEIGLSIQDARLRYLGTFFAPAANEADCVVDAALFHIRHSHLPIAKEEIEEAVWVSPDDALNLPLAPLTRDHVLPIARTLQASRRP